MLHNLSLSTGLTHNNDIALLKVKPLGGSSIKFSDYVQPACLPDAETVYSSGQRCHISGWGSVGWSWRGHGGYSIMGGDVNTGFMSSVWKFRNWVCIMQPVTVSPWVDSMAAILIVFNPIPI